MNIEDMTPEQLRDYALAKEEQRKAITARYMGYEQDEPETAPTRQPWERDVEFEGEVYRVDVRRIKSREFIRMFAKFQAYEKRGEDAPVADALALYDYVFSGDVDAKVCEVVRAKMGYEDFEEIMRIENGLFENIDLKN